MYKAILSICIFLCSVYSVFAAINDKTSQPVEWKSPLPKVSDLGIDLNEVEKLIGGEGQLIFRRDSQPVTIWTKEGKKTYADGVVATAMRVVHQPLEKVRSVVMDYSILNQIQSQHTKVKFVSQRDNHTLYSYDQVYKMAVITLRSGFLVQQTLESDGSISILLHKGDVDAQVLRWEFTALDENRTMLELTFWSAYSTARFAFRILLSVLPKSHLGAPVVFCSMYLEQYADYIEKDRVVQNVRPIDIKSKPVIPLYTKQLSVEGRRLIESLIIKGAVYLRTYQTVNILGKEQKIVVGSSFDMINVPFEHSASIISDIDNLPDSIPYIVSMKKKKKPGAIWTRSKYRFGIFPIMIPLSIHQVFDDTNENCLTFENPGKTGDLYPYSGAYEWSKMKSIPDATFYVFTQSLKNGPHANYFLRVLKKVMPDIECIESIGEGVTAVETRKIWIEKKYKHGMVSN